MKAAAFLLALFLTVYVGMAAGQRCGGDICPAVFQPVCGRKGNQFKTFGNSCVLASSGCRQGFKFHKQGSC